MVDSPLILYSEILTFIEMQLNLSTVTILALMEKKTILHLEALIAYGGERHLHSVWKAKGIV